MGLNEERCVEKYDDGCKHRKTSDDPYSKDWCLLKNDYCNNIKLNTTYDEKSWRKFDGTNQAD